MIQTEHIRLCAVPNQALFFFQEEMGKFQGRAQITFCEYAAVCPQCSVTFGQKDYRSLLFAWMDEHPV